MTRFLLLFLIFSGGLNAMALPADTSAYQFQRLKINSLLAERSAKFGQYDLSLNARTGIFGLQTKNDLRNSNEILRGIILSDNNIFRELKILMNYKDQEVQQVQNNASNSNKRIEAYMLTIKKLQQQNDELKAQAEQVTEKKDTNLYLIIVLVVVIAGWGIYSYSATRRKQ